MSWSIHSKGRRDLVIADVKRQRSRVQCDADQVEAVMQLLAVELSGHDEDAAVEVEAAGSAWKDTVTGKTMRSCRLKVEKLVGFLVACLVALLLPALASAHGYGRGGYGGYGYNAAYVTPYISTVGFYPVAVPVYYPPPVAYAAPAYAAPACAPAVAAPAPACQSPAYAAPPPCAAPAPAAPVYAPPPAAAEAAPVYQPCGYAAVASYGVLPVYSYGGSYFYGVGRNYYPFSGRVFSSYSSALAFHGSRFVPGFAGGAVRGVAAAVGGPRVVRTREVVRAAAVRGVVRGRR